MQRDHRGLGAGSQHLQVMDGGWAVLAGGIQAKQEAQVPGQAGWHTHSLEVQASTGGLFLLH